MKFLLFCRRLHPVVIKLSNSDILKNAFGVLIINSFFGSIVLPFPLGG